MCLFRYNVTVVPFATFDCLPPRLGRIRYPRVAARKAALVVSGALSSLMGIGPAVRQGQTFSLNWLRTFNPNPGAGVYSSDERPASLFKLFGYSCCGRMFYIAIPAVLAIFSLEFTPTDHARNC